jgi:hypothetical protein
MKVRKLRMRNAWVDDLLALEALLEGTKALPRVTRLDAFRHRFEGLRRGGRMPFRAYVLPRTQGL